MRGVGIRHRCRGFPACGYEEGVRLLGFVLVKNQAGQEGVRTRHSANALLSFGRWSSSAKGRHHERPDRDGRHGPPSGDRLAWRSLGRGPRLRAMTRTRGRHVPLGTTTKSAPARRWPHRPGNIQTRKVPNTDADSRQPDWRLTPANAREDKKYAAVDG